MSVYYIEITEEREDGRTIVAAWGDLDAVAYHLRKADLDNGAEYRAEITTSENIFGDRENVAAVTGDAEIVSFVLGKRIRSARKAAETAADEAPAS